MAIISRALQQLEDTLIVGARIGIISWAMVRRLMP